MRGASAHLVSGVIIPVLIIGELAAAYFLVWPAYRGVGEAKALLAAKQSAVQDAQLAVDSVEKLLSDVESKKSGLAAVDEALPPAPEIPQLLANIEYLTNLSGMGLENLQIQGTVGGGAQAAQEAAEKTGTITIDVVVQGSYSQLLAFILNVEKNLRLLDIKSASFAAGDEETGQRSFDLQMTAYYQK